MHLTQGENVIQTELRHSLFLILNSASTSSTSLVKLFRQLNKIVQRLHIDNWLGGTP
jgi:hypothetical protein